MTITPEMQQEAVAAAVVARAERREASLDPEALLGQLADAAYGRGIWSKLPLDKRLAALVKLLEYRASKMRGQSSTPDSPEPDGGDIPTMTIV